VYGIGWSTTLVAVKRRQLLVAAAAVVVTSQAMPSRRAATATQLPAVRTAYQFAAANYETLRYIPCYCGCGLSSGHLNNYDCFVKSATSDGWLLLAAPRSSWARLWRPRPPIRKVPPDRDRGPDELGRTALSSPSAPPQSDTAKEVTK